MENKKIKCRDCSNLFDFNIKEQKFYEEKGFTPPVRCKTCREARKSNKATEILSTSEVKTYKKKENRTLQLYDDSFIRMMIHKFENNTIKIEEDE